MTKRIAKRSRHSGHKPATVAPDMVITLRTGLHPSITIRGVEIGDLAHVLQYGIELGAGEAPIATMQIRCRAVIVREALA